MGKEAVRWKGRRGCQPGRRTRQRRRRGTGERVGSRSWDGTGWQLRRCCRGNLRRRSRRYPGQCPRRGGCTGRRFRRSLGQRRWRGRGWRVWGRVGGHGHFERRTVWRSRKCSWGCCWRGYRRPIGWDFRRCWYFGRHSRCHFRRYRRFRWCLGSQLPGRQSCIGKRLGWLFRRWFRRSFRGCLGRRS